VSENSDEIVHRAEALHLDPYVREDTITIILSVVHHPSGEVAFRVYAALHQRSFSFGIAMVSDDGFRG